MITPDPTSLQSQLDWLFNGASVTIFGNPGMMIGLLLAVIFSLLMFINANKWTTIGFFGSTLFAFSMFGYATVGWMGVIGVLMIGFFLGLGLIWIFRL